MALFAWLSALQEDAAEALALDQDAEGRLRVDVSGPVREEMGKKVKKW